MIKYWTEVAKIEKKCPAVKKNAPMSAVVRIEYILVIVLAKKAPKLSAMLKIPIIIVNALVLPPTLLMKSLNIKPKHAK